MADIRIRSATSEDLEVINDIYNHYVLHSTATYQDDPESMEQRRTWFTQHGPEHPVTVTEVEGQIVGWASLSPFRARSAYRRTVENSVYIHHAHHGRGIGSAMLKDLIVRARAIGHHTVIAGIDSEQTASLILHDRFGFIRVAHLREAGFKFGRWLDVIYLQLML